MLCEWDCLRKWKTPLHIAMGLRNSLRSWRLIRSGIIKFRNDMWNWRHRRREEGQVLPLPPDFRPLQRIPLEQCLDIPDLHLWISARAEEGSLRKWGQRDSGLYQELSILATQLGLDMNTKEFQGTLQYNLAPCLRKLTINKKYNTTDEAVDDLQPIDTENRLVEEMKTGRKSGRTQENPDEPTIGQLQKEIAALKRTQHNQSTGEQPEARKCNKRERKIRTPGWIDEPCPRGDDCTYKDQGKCWRKH